MRKIYIERQQSIIKVALKENDVLKECFLEAESERPKVGEIYKGVVKNIVGSMHCAFVDIGYKKNAYISLEGKVSDRELKKGDEVLVEIIKEEIGKKGPKVSNSISLPGAYVVVTTEHKDIQISRKIDCETFKSQIIKDIEKPDNIGIVVRTKAQDADFHLVKNEVKELLDKYKDIYNKFTYSSKVGCLYKDRGILSRLLRNNMDSELELVVNNEKDYEFYYEYLKTKKIENVDLKLYDGNLSIFDEYEIERDILALRHNKIKLPSGGNIVIESTEAMFVIDVNSAQNTKGTKSDSAIFTTNLEAAREIARQIRLRNLGGMILVDFIDMKFKDEKSKILLELEQGFQGDKNCPKVYPFTELNLVQITRRKYGESIMDYLLKPCKSCLGSGYELNLNYISSIIMGKVRRIKEEQGVKNIFITINDCYKDEVMGNILDFVEKIDALDCDIYIEFERIEENFKVEPLLFHSQLENYKGLKVFSVK